MHAPTPNVIAVFLLKKISNSYSTMIVVMRGWFSLSEWGSSRKKNRRGEIFKYLCIGKPIEQCRSIEWCRNNIEHCCGLTTGEKKVKFDKRLCLCDFMFRAKNKFFHLSTSMNWSMFLSQLISWFNYRARRKTRSVNNELENSLILLFITIIE